KIVEGEYWDESGNYTQEGMGNPAGPTFLYTPTYNIPFSGVTGNEDDNIDAREYGCLPYPIIIGGTCQELYAKYGYELGNEFRAGMLSPAASAVYCDVYFHVIGVYETNKPILETLYYLAPLEAVQEMQGWDANTANYICVNAPDGMSDKEIRNTLAPVIGDYLFYSYGDIANIWEGNLAVIGAVILGVTLATTLVLAAFAIKFVMDSIIVRKTREIGTIKALGARDRDVMRIFLYQALVIGLSAAILGFVLAWGAMALLSAYGSSLTYSLGAKMEMHFILTPLAAVAAFGIPIAISLIASIVPCRKVARLSPIEAIRRGQLQTTSKKTRFSLIAWLLCHILPAYKKHKVNSATLAVDEMHDHKAIYSVVMFVIALSLAVFILQASYQAHLETGVTHTMKDTMCGDGMVCAAGSTPRMTFGNGAKIEDADALAEQVRSSTGYTTVVRSCRNSVVVLGTDTDPIYEGGVIWGIDVADDENVFNLKDKLIAGEYFEDKDYSQNLIGEQAQNIPGLRASGLSTTMIGEILQEPYPIIIGKTCAEGRGLEVGSEYSILMTRSEKGPTGIVSAPVKVIGIYSTQFGVPDAMVNFVPRVMVNEMMGYNPEDGNAVIVKVPDPGNYVELYEKLSSAAPEYTSMSWHEAVVFMIGPAFDAMLMIIYTSIAITLLLAAVIIMYAMDSSVARKTREIGTLKALGARDRTIVKMVMNQGLIIGVVSGLVAALIAYAMAYIVVNIVHMQSNLPMGVVMDVGFKITMPVVIIAFFAPIIVGVISASLPAKHAARLSPVEALRKGELAM
ncbi:MAG: hypothetical protein CVT48_06760, partial [Thermoplasmata archaeon HGW-Thermoplasmata-1]